MNRLWFWKQFKCYKLYLLSAHSDHASVTQTPRGTDLDSWTPYWFSKLETSDMYCKSATYINYKVPQNQAVFNLINLQKKQKRVERYNFEGFVFSIFHFFFFFKKFEILICRFFVFFVFFFVRVVYYMCDSLCENQVE